MSGSELLNWKPTHNLSVYVSLV